MAVFRLFKRYSKINRPAFLSADIWRPEYAYEFQLQMASSWIELILALEMLPTSVQGYRYKLGRIAAAEQRQRDFTLRYIQPERLSRKNSISVPTAWLYPGWIEMIRLWIPSKLIIYRNSKVCGRRKKNSLRTPIWECCIPWKAGIIWFVSSHWARKGYPAFLHMKIWNW